MGVVIDGKAVSLKIKDEIKRKIELLKGKFGISPKLALIIAGDDAASQIYVNNKEKACAYVGMESLTLRFPSDVEQGVIESEIKRLAADASVNGIMVQLPLPKGLDANRILSLIPTNKDVDGLTSGSEGALLVGDPCFFACTPKGVIAALESYNIPLEGKHAVIVGRSNMVGKPLAIGLLAKNCTVTICHSRTQDLANYTKMADILVCAVGHKHLITRSMVKQGAVVVDVGINRVDGKIYGDVDFDGVKDIASYITPVPGGIGVMTVTMLISNTFEGCLAQNAISEDLL